MAGQARTRVFVETSALTTGRLSGVGHTVLEILRAWQNTPKLEVVLLAPLGKAKQLRGLGLHLPIKTIPLPDQLLRVLRRFNLVPPLDIFLGQAIYLFPNYWNWPLARSKSVTYVYDVSFLAHPEFTEPANQKFLARHLPAWLRRSDRIVTISRHARDELVRYCQVDPQKIEIIYNGVDAKVFGAATPQAIQAAKQKYGIEGEYVLFVGNIEPRKNISKLIAAYRLLPEPLRNMYSLVIVGGGGWNNQQILDDIAHAKQEGFHVQKVPQYVPDADLPALYAGATVLAHPALYEGFGMTPLEAMAAGTPVIVARTSSLPEVVGDAGLYVEPSDEHDISAKIKVLLEDAPQREALAQAGRAQAARFTWVQTATALATCIQTLAEAHHEQNN